MIQARAEAMIRADPDPELEQLTDLSESMGVLANNLRMKALQLYGGDESRYTRKRTKVAMDLHARDTTLVRIFRDNDAEMIPDATPSSTAVVFGARASIQMASRVAGAS